MFCRPPSCQIHLVHLIVVTLLLMLLSHLGGPILWVLNTQQHLMLTTNQQRRQVLGRMQENVQSALARMQLANTEAVQQIYRGRISLTGDPQETATHLVTLCATIAEATSFYIGTLDGRFIQVRGRCGAGGRGPGGRHRPRGRGMRGAVRRTLGVV